MRRYFFISLLLATAGVATVAVIVWLQSHGIHVTVINRGPEPLAQVVIHVTGNEHAIGDLAVGEARTVRVRPSSESHIELSFADSLGRPHRLNVGGYLEPGYRGTIEVELEACAIKRNHHDIRLY